MSRLDVPLGTEPAQVLAAHMDAHDVTATQAVRLALSMLAVVDAPERQLLVRRDGRWYAADFPYRP